MIRRSKGKVIEKCEGVIASEWHFFMKKIGVRWKLSSGISNRALLELFVHISIAFSQF